MIKVILGVYLTIGILSILYRMDRLQNDLEAQGSFFKVRLYQVIITLGAIILWPFRLASFVGQDKKSGGIQFFNEVSESFQKVATERGETIDGDTMAFIVSKFTQVNKQFGSDLYREHLKYELEKYKKEGLRVDYLKAE